MANLEAYGEKVVGLTGSVVSWTQTQASGTKIAEIDIDGTTTDVYAPSGGGGSVNYSTTEQVVGTWLGKPLYQKTIDTGTLPNNTYKHVNHGISDLENVITIEGWAKSSSNNIPLPRVGTSNVCGLDATSTYINFVTNANYSSYTTSYVTIRYTKTTD